ncbi:hypothetical protein GBAR_LOCUS16135 [Geodia barretti]|uniref:Uncharacterized protein n=1 Tax=Geodia barretti TaxID=519541 RepID=A0AA35SFK7_GEOBA|nr:hypothetical protein GBAR_LOCUS16135 [Geodia barretti]
MAQEMGGGDNTVAEEIQFLRRKGRMEISEGTSLVGSIQGPGGQRGQLSRFGKCMILLLIIAVVVLLVAIVAILILCVGKNGCNYP